MADPRMPACIVQWDDVMTNSTLHRGAVEVIAPVVAGARSQPSSRAPSYAQTALNHPSCAPSHPVHTRTRNHRRFGPEGVGARLQYRWPRPLDRQLRADSVEEVCGGRMRTFVYNAPVEAGDPSNTAVPNEIPPVTPRSVVPIVTAIARILTLPLLQDIASVHDQDDSVDIARRIGGEKSNRRGHLQGSACPTGRCVARGEALLWG
jgi:hypothetical protein